MKTFDWMAKYRPSCKYDLAKNELHSQYLTEMGVETSYSEFQKEKDPENYFKETVAALYGIDAENVIPTIGGTEGIFIAAAFLGTVSQRIIVPLPEYDPIFDVPKTLGNRVDAFNEEELLSNARKDDSVMLTSPGNPGGKFRTELYGNLMDSIGKDSRIYVDETFSEFHFSKRPTTLFGTDDRTFCSTTMTKFFGLSAIRTGWIMAEKKEMHSLATFKSVSSGSNPLFSLWVAANALNRRNAFAKKIQRILEQNLPVADGFVGEFEDLEWEKPDSAPFGFVRYRSGEDSVTLCKDVFKKTGVLLVPGSFFGVENGFRLCFFLPPDENREAFEVLSDYFRKGGFN